MKKAVENHFHEVLSHLYINPLEKCNLRCKICYTRKTDPALKEEEIIEFIAKYQKVQKLESVTFCGGEVFALPYFTGLVNKLIKEGPAAHVSQTSLQNRSTSWGSRPVKLRLGAPRSRHPLFTKNNKGIFVQIITNGTIDRLTELENPNMINLIVSIDGLRQYHDKNRGEGNFDKSMKFLLKARSLGFHTEIFSIVTRQNYYQIPEFEEYLNSALTSHSGKPSPDLAHPESVGDSGQACLRRQARMTSDRIHVTYHPRKPPSYLLHHPVSNLRGITAGFDFLNHGELMTLMKYRKTFPPINLGCFQIALASDGKVYGCCEGTVPIGKIDDKIENLFDRLVARLEIWDKKNKIGKCLGCSQPDFVCGFSMY